VGRRRVGDWISFPRQSAGGVCVCERVFHFSPSLSLSSLPFFSSAPPHACSFISLFTIQTNDFLQSNVQPVSSPGTLCA
jgi:hypothetical protein